MARNFRGNLFPQPRSVRQSPKKRSTSPSPSIPAKAGISFSRQREFSAKRNIAMVACRRMRLRRRDSGFRRNGSFLISPSISFLFPPPPHFHSRESGNLFPRQREIPRSGNQCRLSANAAVAAEIPAFAGMEEGGGNGRRGREWKRMAGMERGARNGRRCCRCLIRTKRNRAGELFSAIFPPSPPMSDRCCPAIGFGSGR